MTDPSIPGTCPECGAGRDANDGFCGVCGAVLAALHWAAQRPTPGGGRRLRRLVMVAALVPGVALELALLGWMLIAR